MRQEVCVCLCVRVLGAAEERVRRHKRDLSVSSV